VASPPPFHLAAIEDDLGQNLHRNDLFHINVHGIPTAGVCIGGNCTQKVQGMYALLNVTDS
jgi:hypothetical protein